MALVQYPVLNSSVDENCEKITYKVKISVQITKRPDILKYCLKGPLSPKKPTNQPTNYKNLDT